jgi:hypothetical protein
MRKQISDVIKEDINESYKSNTNRNSTNYNNINY